VVELTVLFIFIVLLLFFCPWRTTEGGSGTKTKSGRLLPRKKRARGARNKLKQRLLCAAIVDMNSQSRGAMAMRLHLDPSHRQVELGLRKNFTK